MQRFLFDNICLNCSINFPIFSGQSSGWISARSAAKLHHLLPQLPGASIRGRQEVAAATALSCCSLLQAGRKEGRNWIQGLNYRQQKIPENVLRARGNS